MTYNPDPTIPNSPEPRIFGVVPPENPDGLGRDCPDCGNPLGQHGWCSMDEKSATDWVKCPNCGYEKRSNGYETVERHGEVVLFDG